jgi:formylglycine-generating enzyme required for sulfatase activity
MDRRWPLRSILVQVLIVMMLFGCSGPSSGAALLERAEDIADTGDWPAAVDMLLDAHESPRSAERASLALADLTLDLLRSGIELPVDTELRLIAWMEDEERVDTLARLLTASTVLIPGGWMTMGTDDGDPDEGPARRVWVDSFAIDRYEVTNLVFAPFASDTGAAPPHWDPDGYPAGSARYPVVGVSWRQAADFCASIGRRLPTEVEWERACGGPAGDRFPWGARWDSAAANVAMAPLARSDEAWGWLVDNSEEIASPGPVGPPVAGVSAEGVCNLAGNASEWVQDWYDPDAYTALGTVNPVATGPQWNHVLRGGAWFFRGDDPEAMQASSQCTARNASHALSDPRVGFRCAADR